MAGIGTGEGVVIDAFAKGNAMSLSAKPLLGDALSWEIALFVLVM